MPTVVTLRVRVYEEARLIARLAPARGFFLAVLKQMSATWSQQLHDGAQVPGRAETRAAYSVAPFHYASPSVAPARFAPLPVADERVSAGTTLCLRIGFARDEEAVRFLVALPQQASALPRLGRAKCPLLRIPQPSSEDIDVLHFDWETLAAVPACHRLRIEFLTPTTFSSQGHYVPRCEPERLWYSWARWWTTFAHPPFCEWGKEACLTQTVLPLLHTYELYTQPVPLKTDAPFVAGNPKPHAVYANGFVGWSEWVFRSGAPEADRQRVCALATVADFLGTGAKCTFGLGQTRCTLFPEG